MSRNGTPSRSPGVVWWSITAYRGQMLPRLSGSGWTWETKVTRLAGSKPRKNRSERREEVLVVLLPSSETALKRAINANPRGGETKAVNLSLPVGRVSDGPFFVPDKT